MVGLKRLANKVKTVFVGFDPGCKSSTEYEGHRREAISGTNLRPILLQLGSLLLQASLEQGHGNSSLSKSLQQGPITRKLNCPPTLGQILPCFISALTSLVASSKEVTKNTEPEIHSEKKSHP